MTIDPKTLVTVIGASGPEVWLSELDALMVAQSDTLGATPKPEDVTAGLGAAIQKGWLHSDGLRVSVSRSGQRAVLGS